MDPAQAQENISYARALNSEHQLELLNTLAAVFATNEYRLLIVDSIMACFRVDYCGRGELADRQQKLNQFLSRLTRMAEEFNVCVLMVRILSIAEALGDCVNIVANEVDRRIKFNLTLARARSLPAQTDASQ